MSIFDQTKFAPYTFYHVATPPKFPLSPFQVLKGNDVRLRVHGIGLTNGTRVKLTTAKAAFGDSCKSESHHVQTKIFELANCHVDGLAGDLDILGEELPSFKDKGRKKGTLTIIDFSSDIFLYTGIP